MIVPESTSPSMIYFTLKAFAWFMLARWVYADYAVMIIWVGVTLKLHHQNSSLYFTVFRGVCSARSINWPECWSLFLLLLFRNYRSRPWKPGKSGRTRQPSPLHPLHHTAPQDSNAGTTHTHTHTVFNILWSKSCFCMYILNPKNG